MLSRCGSSGLSTQYKLSPFFLWQKQLGHRHHKRSSHSSWLLEATLVRGLQFGPWILVKRSCFLDLDVKANFFAVFWLQHFQTMFWISNAHVGDDLKYHYSLSCILVTYTSLTAYFCLCFALEHVYICKLCLIDGITYDGDLADQLQLWPAHSLLDSFSSLLPELF